jgi:alpha-beta hydrolase superfamily lysophospholipase
MIAAARDSQGAESMKITGESTMPARVPARQVEIRTATGTKLKARWWRRPDPRGLVIIVHGFGEHGGTYERLAQMLGAAIAVDVIAPDLRGHGLSPGRRGVVRTFDDLTSDLESVVDWSARERLPGPHFLLGHSQGGQVVLRLVLRHPRSIPAMVLSNPALRIAVPVPPAKLAIGRFLLKYAPWVTLSGKLRADLLTRDPEIQEEHRSDPLRHSRMSAPLFFGMVEGGNMMVARAAEIKIPTLLLVGGQDPVIDPAAAREFFDRLGSEDKTMHLYPKMLHEPFSEVGREQVFDDVVRWLLPRL